MWVMESKRKEGSPSQTKNDAKVSRSETLASFGLHISGLPQFEPEYLLAVELDDSGQTVMKRVSEI